MMCSTCFANEDLFREAKVKQRERSYEMAIDKYRALLLLVENETELTKSNVIIYTDALVQLMNCYQSIGQPQECISALDEIFIKVSIFQNKCLRDYYAVAAYAMSRTENMSAAEEMMIKALTLPLYDPTPERYFRDYAYAAAVFYSNPEYQKEVIQWCQEALFQAELSNNISGKQWVTAMLGSIYKSKGELNKALELFQESKEDAHSRNDYLGELNSLHKLVDLFIYWNIPEYANLYASEAIRVEKKKTVENPMISAQTYINKGRALHQLGKLDSIAIYSEYARKLCESLPYNSGMVDIDLLNGICHTENGGEDLYTGIQELERVTRQATSANRTKAFHQLAQTYLKHGQLKKADMMLDSLYALVHENSANPYILHIDYKPILDHYLKTNNKDRREKFVQLIIDEQQIYKKNKVNSDLVGAIVDFQTEKRIKELQIRDLEQTNQRLWLLISLAISIVIISAIAFKFVNQKKRYTLQIKEADDKITSLVQKLKESNVEKEMVAREIKEILSDKDKRQELETLTPYILKESGEIKFRQCFELLYPLFLPRLREKIPSVTRREELLSMLIVLKQDNKKIAELLAIAPRSVLMLRHRFRQKIGMPAEFSLENFIEDTLDHKN